MQLDREQNGQRSTWKRRARAWSLAACSAAFAAGCTGGNLDGTSPSFLIIKSLQGASGATPSQLANFLSSDVQTMVKVTNGQGVQVLQPTIFADPGLVSFTLGLKDPGTTESPTKPTPTNFITITRYHVDYIRSDGHNVQGTDVPFSFDGAATATVSDVGGSISITLVRVQAKEEAPLAALIGGGGAVSISTIARVTIYGTDQTGKAVSVTGDISVNFSDWGDPQ
jgi:hypothetical protein